MNIGQFLPITIAVEWNDDRAFVGLRNLWRNYDETEFREGRFPAWRLEYVGDVPWVHVHARDEAALETFHALLRQAQPTWLIEHAGQ